MFCDTQIREVFHFHFPDDRAFRRSLRSVDLAILIRGGYSPPGPWSRLLTRTEYTQALDCLMSLGWEDYQGHVVEFLDASSREEFGGKPVNVGSNKAAHPYFHPLSCVPYLLGKEQGYVSFLTALHLHCVISQIPKTIQIATTGRVLSAMESRWNAIQS